MLCTCRFKGETSTLQLGNVRTAKGFFWNVLLATQDSIILWILSLRIQWRFPKPISNVASKPARAANCKGPWLVMEPHDGRQDITWFEVSRFDSQIERGQEQNKKTQQAKLGHNHLSSPGLQNKFLTFLSQEGIVLGNIPIQANHDACTRKHGASEGVKVSPFGSAFLDPSRILLFFSFFLPFSPIFSLFWRAAMRWGGEPTSTQMSRLARPGCKLESWLPGFWAPQHCYLLLLDLLQTTGPYLRNKRKKKHVLLGTASKRNGCVTILHLLCTYIRLRPKCLLQVPGV